MKLNKKLEVLNKFNIFHNNKLLTHNYNIDNIFKISWTGKHVC